MPQPPSHIYGKLPEFNDTEPPLPKHDMHVAWMPQVSRRPPRM